MKTFVGVICFLLICCTCASGQEKILVLIKKKNQAEKQFHEGKRLKVFTSDGNMYKGKFKVINDSSLCIAADTIRLTQITKIRVKTPSNIIPGAVIGGAGLLGSWLGITLIAESTTAAGYAKLFSLVFGLPITVVGILTTGTGILILVNGKKYSVKEWRFSVGNALSK